MRDCNKRTAIEPVWLRLRIACLLAWRISFLLYSVAGNNIQTTGTLQYNVPWHLLLAQSSLYVANAGISVFYLMISPIFPYTDWSYLKTSHIVHPFVALKKIYPNNNTVQWLSWISTQHGAWERYSAVLSDVSCELSKHLAVVLYIWKEVEIVITHL